MPTYKKLVRDRIPEIIEATGRKPVVEVLSDEQYVQEYLEAENVEELAYILEVIFA